MTWFRRLFGLRPSDAGADDQGNARSGNTQSNTSGSPQASTGGRGDNQIDRASIVIARICLGVVLVGVIIVLVYCNTYSGKATIFAWMLACLLVGTFIGFLFGIPKILQGGGQNPPPPPPTGTAASQGATGTNPPTPPPSPTATGISYQQQVNTNLTEISDWLTKIIVGLGLVNLKQIPAYLDKYAGILAGALFKSATAKGVMEPLAFAFSYGTIIGYTILGFLFGYISTRVYLSTIFLTADRRSLDLDKALTEITATKAAVDSANLKAEFALVNATTAPATQAGNPATPNVQPTAAKTLTQLINEYNDIRQTMKPSSNRTSRMTEVIVQMVRIAPLTENFDLIAMLKDNDNGNRLAAYAYLYARPDYARLGDLVEALIADRAPFNQFWAIQSLGKVIGLQPDNRLPQDLMNKLQTYYDNLGDGWDRKYELAKIIPALKK